jgi:hypothetical protein
MMMMSQQQQNNNNKIEESVEDYVWEHYCDELGIRPSDFGAHIVQSFPLFDVLHETSWRRVCQHLAKKADEHWVKYSKLKLIQSFMDDDLRDCLDSFLKQQERLFLVYSSLRSTLGPR